MVGGHRGVEAQLGAFFSQVIAYVEGFQGGERQFHSHALDEAEDILCGTGAGGELGGQESHLGWRERDGIHRGNPEETNPSLADLSPFAVGFDLLVIGANASVLKVTLVGSDE